MVVRVHILLVPILPQWPPDPFPLQAEGTVGTRAPEKGTPASGAHSISLRCSRRPAYCPLSLLSSLPAQGPIRSDMAQQSPTKHFPRFGPWPSTSSVVPLKRVHPFLHLSESPSFASVNFF